MITVIEGGGDYGAVHTIRSIYKLDRSQFALRKCSHSFRSISVRI